MPTAFALAAGASEGPCRLNARDGALLVAGIGGPNQVKIASVLPAGARQVAGPEAVAGALVPTAQGTVAERTVRAMVAAAFAWRGRARAAGQAKAAGTWSSASAPWSWVSTPDPPPRIGARNRGGKVGQTWQPRQDLTKGLEKSTVQGRRNCGCRRALRALPPSPRLAAGTWRVRIAKVGG